MNSYRKYGIALLTGALLVAGWAGNALALTDACVEIANQASLTYSVGGELQPTVTSTDGVVDATGPDDELTEFYVATKVDLTISTNNTVRSVTPGVVDNVMTFQVMNTGNDTQRYSLRLWKATNDYSVTLPGPITYSDDFDMGTVRVYIDNDNVFPAGAVAVDENSDGLFPADGSHLGYTGNVNGNNGFVYVHIVANTPIGQADGSDAIYAIQALTHQITGRQGGNNAAAASDGGETDESIETANICGSAIVLADNQVTGTGAAGAGPGGVTDIARNGDAFAVGIFTVNSATISMTKSYAVIDDGVAGNAVEQAIPGARIEYTMTITNSSLTTAATGLSLVDQIPANTDFYGGSITGPGTPDYSTTALPGPPVWGAAAPGNGVIAPTITYIKMDSFDLPAGSTAEIKFQVVIE